MIRPEPSSCAAPAIMAATGSSSRESWLKRGWPVQIALLGDPGRFERRRWRSPGIAWTGKTCPLKSVVLSEARLVVDALFGAGLERPIAGEVREVLEVLDTLDVPIIAVDVPSGIDGDTGAILGFAVKADITVTFHRPKPGHYLLPGREHVGRLITADIGIPLEVDRVLDIKTFANLPACWMSSFPQRMATGHKYSHGHGSGARRRHQLVGCGEAGGDRRSSRGRRAGDRALSLASALPVYAASLTAVMVDPFKDDGGFVEKLQDPRRNAILLGPGAGVGASLRSKVLTSLAAGKASILDADALTSFADQTDVLFGAIKTGGDCLLTPHEGEFSRLFALEGDKLTRARRAAVESDAVVLLKGADTVVASPDGRASILTDAPPTLATAGSGDVLAGIALGLIAQSMPTFEAASASAWLHAEAGKAFGPGLIAEDLPDMLPSVLAKL